MRRICGSLLKFRNPPTANAIRSTSFPVTEIIRIGNDKHKARLLYELGAGELRVRVYAASRSTITLDANAECDVVRHRKGHCQLCGGRFDANDPRAPQKPEWCADCYERFVVNRGKFHIANLLALTGYDMRIGALSPRPRAPRKKERA